MYKNNKIYYLSCQYICRFLDTLSDLESIKEKIMAKKNHYVSLGGKVSKYYKGELKLSHHAKKLLDKFK